MARQKLVTYWAADFETTVWGKEIEKNLGEQTKTEVWASACVQLYDKSETVYIHQSIRDFIDFVLSQKGNNIIYFHNLAFDGSFIVDFLLKNGFTHVHVEKDKEMVNGDFQTSISDMGSWYTLKIKKYNRIVEIRNSLKLIPTSLEAMGKAFNTKHRKLSMEYEGLRYAYCTITDEEKEYIKNDVLVLKEALEKMFDEGHSKLTIGSCCMHEFKNTYDKKDYENLFPDLREVDFPCGMNAWEYVHKSYAGGWCYVSPKYASKLVTNGVVYDVNSLYPSMMSSESGNYYPVGKPQYFAGKPHEKLDDITKYYYFVRFKCRFKLKENALPWVHIRGSWLYKANENLTTTDVRVKGKYYRYYNDNGVIKDTITTITMTCVDLKLFFDTYDVYDFEWIDGCYFHSLKGIFDEYINLYRSMKENNTGFLRTLAKLFLNNLYGKLASSDNSSYKVPYLDENGVVKFTLHEEHNKQVGYIPCGSAITSYARNFTIRHALANVDRFCYADTDSIHLVGQESANMVVEHNTAFCCWKQECMFDEAYYLRQKVYAEHVIAENHIPVEKPYLDLKCAGMGKGAKEAFIERGYKITDLEIGLQLEDCNLKATRIEGGILLKNKTFNLRKSVDKKVTV